MDTKKRKILLGCFILVLVIVITLLIFGIYQDAGLFPLLGLSFNGLAAIIFIYVLYANKIN